MTEVIYDEVLIEEVRAQDADAEESGEVAVDIVKNEEELVVIAPISGVAREHLSVRVNSNVLVISGRRVQPSISGSTYLVQECFWGKFNRTIVLPSFVDTRHMKATFKNGTLVVTIPILEDRVEKELEIVEE